MITAARVMRSSSPSNRQDPDRFLEMLPIIQDYARSAFRHFGAEARDDAIAEIVANSYVAYARLLANGKLDVAFATVIAQFAIRQFRSGRRVGSRFTVRDVTSQIAQRRHGFVVEGFDQVDPSTGEWVEAMVGNTGTPVPDQAAFRCDFPAWLRKQNRRNRRIAEALVLGHTTADVARRFRLSAGRISQLRHELYNSWLAFHGEGGVDSKRR